MNITEIKLGTKLEFELINNLGEKFGQTYISQLLDILDNNNIAIAAPIYESRVVYIPEGAKARIFFFHNKFGLMSFPVTIHSKERQDNIAVLFARIEGEVEKIQRRKYYRLDSNIDVYYRICDDTETNEQLRSAIEKDIDVKALSSEYKKGLTKNLSGSGACIVVEENIPRGSVIELVLWLDGSTCVRTICKVVRTSEIGISKDKKYELGLHFIEITRRVQNLIIKYIFEQQKQILKRQSEN